MCRILAYLGPELPLDELLLNPSNSLINQARAPQHHPLMQLAGWGFGAWSDKFCEPEEPILYRRPVPAFFDDNARTVLPSLTAHTAVAHVRAATYRSETVMADENCHPFRFKGSPWILVHNGSVPHWRVLQKELLVHCKTEYLGQIRGTTDTEFLFCLLLSLLEDDSLDGFQAAFQKLIQLLTGAMKTLDLVKSCKLKLALASPNSVVAVNYGSGLEGETDIKGDWRELRKTKLGSPPFLISTILEPLYIQTGRDFQKQKDCFGMTACPESSATTAILASEPLTSDTESWTELEYGGLIRLDRDAGEVKISRRQLEL